MITELVERFEFFAQQHISLKHQPGTSRNCAFKHFDPEAMQAAVRIEAKFPCLFLQTPEVEKGGDRGSVSETLECSFYVIKPIPKGASDGLMRQVINDCKVICDDIFNRALSDQDTEVLQGLQVATSEGSIGPMHDNCYGWVVAFTIDQGYNAEVNASKWEDLS